MIYFISLLLILSIGFNIIIFLRWYNLARIVLVHEEAIEECLDGIDVAYSNIDKILQSPLATNDPKVLQIHHELRRVHHYLLQIANRLSTGWSNQTETVVVEK